MLDLFLIGTSHRVAGVAARERLAAACVDARHWLTEIRTSSAHIAEAFVLATCHRMECYTVTADAEAAERDLTDLVRRQGRGDLLGPAAPRYVLTGEDAVRHLGRVASGLDSMILGEAEIAGQIRRAAALAREEKTSGVFLQRVIAGALRASGRVRSETELGVGTVSTATAGVSLIEHALGSLKGRTILVIGAGEVGRQAASRLQKRRAGSILVSSRSEKHAADLATRTGATVVPLADVERTIAGVDAILAAVQSPVPLVTSTMCSGHDVSRPLVVVDLSMPRVVDEAVSNVPGVTLRSVDDLGDIVRASLARRARAVPHAERIVQHEATLVYEQFRSRQTRRSA